MAIYFNSSQYPNFDQKNSWKVVVGAIIGLIILFWLAKGVFYILNIAAPFLLIITMIMNYKVVLGFGSWLLDLLKKDIIVGLLASVGTVVFFPVVSAYLFGKMLLLRKVNKMKSDYTDQSYNIKDDYTSYEEVDEIEIPPLELPKKFENLNKPNNYDKFFDQK